MDIIWGKEKKGWPSRINWPGIVSALVRTDRVSAFKIGMTGDPDTRSKTYAGYDDMFLVYKTQSAKHEKLVEDQLIQRYHDWWDGCDNISPGGVGRPAGDRKWYYVYIALW
ncbi:MAG: hypothetical protein HYY01_01150 [Chloroflexi bacterium]|nr:hypothetical protein [Chloroflexota bacterium]